MKTHELNFDFLSNDLLLGFNVSQYETRNEETQLYYPTFRIRIGFIFFTVSYKNTDYTTGEK